MVLFAGIMEGINIQTGEEMKVQKKLGFIYMNIWFFLAISVLVMAGMTFVAIPYIKEGSMVYHDFVLGETAYWGGNKTGEWDLFWLIWLLGCVAAVVCACMEKIVTNEQETVSHIQTCVKNAALCFLPGLTHVLIYGGTTAEMVILTCLTAAVVCLYPKRAKELLVLFVCIYFFLQAVAAVLAVAVSNYFLGDHKVFILAVSLWAITLLVEHFDKKHWSEMRTARMMDWIQIPIPLLLCVYLKNKYISTEGLHKVSFPLVYVIIIVLLIEILIVANIFFLKKGMKKGAYVTTAFSVFAFVSYVSPAMIMPLDMHHHGEQMLAWQQIVELGQTAYDGYAPASGMFPMLIGAINSILFDGTITTYAMSYSLFMLGFEAIIIWLLWRRVGETWTLFISVLFHMPVYCRTWIFVPALLILTDKNRIQKRIHWVFCWIFTCFLCGLYYPLYGGAILIGTLPFGISQIVRIFRGREWKNWKKKTEWVFAAIVMILVMISVPLLYRMFLHIVSMGGQTLAVDGEAILKSGAPEWFMPYLGTLSIRDLLYYVMRLPFGVLFVIGSLYALTKYVKQTVSQNKESKDIWEWLNNPGFAALSPIPIVLSVAFTYTMVCMDENWVANILSRSAHVILFVCGMYGLVVIKEYADDLFGAYNRKVLMALAFCIPFLFFYHCEDYHFPSMEGTTDGDAYVIGEYQSKLYPYMIREGYTIVTPQMKNQYPHINFERIGNGYVRTETMDSLEKNSMICEFLKSYEPDVRLLGFEMSQMYYYLLNEKTVYSGRTAIAKSAKATEAVIEQLDEYTVIRTGVVPVDQYYLYRYLVKQGYVYSPELELYMPNALYKKIYGVDGSLAASTWTAPYDCHYVANAFGKSVDTLETCEKMDDVSYSCTIYGEGENICLLFKTDEIIRGNEADFLRLQLEHVNDKKVYVKWPQGDGIHYSELQLDCKDGNLLIPLGINADWMQREHQEILIVIEDMAETDEVVVGEFGFYHLK